MVVRRLIAAASTALIVSGCDGLVVIVSSPGVVLVSSPTSRDIVFGQTVFGTVSTQSAFDLVVPSTGILVVRLSWNTWSSGTQLVLRVGGTAFPGAHPHGSPIVGRLPVTRGERHRLIVEAAGADWSPNDQFTLTTALE
jgi:hypothetical protein